MAIDDPWLVDRWCMVHVPYLLKLEAKIWKEQGLQSEGPDDLNVYANNLM
jgi:hypothetical protein